MNYPQKPMRNPTIANYVPEKTVKAKRYRIRKITRYTNLVLTAILNISLDASKLCYVDGSTRKDALSFPCFKTRVKNPSYTTLTYAKECRVVAVGCNSPFQAVLAIQFERLKILKALILRAQRKNKPDFVRPVLINPTFNNAVVACNVGHKINRIDMANEYGSLVTFDPPTFAGFHMKNMKKLELKDGKMHVKNGFSIKLPDGIGVLAFHKGCYNILGYHLPKDLKYIQKCVEEITSRFNTSEPVINSGEKIANRLDEEMRQRRNYKTVAKLAK